MVIEAPLMKCTWSRRRDAQRDIRRDETRLLVSFRLPSCGLDCSARNFVRTLQYGLADASTPAARPRATPRQPQGPASFSSDTGPFVDIVLRG